MCIYIIITSPTVSFLYHIFITVARLPLLNKNVSHLKILYVPHSFIHSFLIHSSYNSNICHAFYSFVLFLFLFLFLSSFLRAHFIMIFTVDLDIRRNCVNLEYIYTVLYYTHSKEWENENLLVFPYCGSQYVYVSFDHLHPHLALYSFFFIFDSLCKWSLEHK